MSTSELTVQVRSGGFTGPRSSPGDIKQAIDRALDILPLRRVIMGWAPDRAINAQTAAQLRARGVELYLWLPVFSEVGLLRPCSPVLDPIGQPSTPYQLDATESFDFYCPTDPDNIQAALAIFDEYFDAADFDGVFLDKIRYPSFASSFGCFCPRCQAIYRNAGLAFNGHNWQVFFDIRTQIISDALETICTGFRAKGLSIGLDVFTPFLTTYVGQDIPALSTMADFIKPMMYARTNAPAGLPFELDALDKAMSLTHNKEDYCNLDFCAKEVAWMQTVSDCPIYPGFEVNRIPGIADTSPDYIKDCLTAYKDADGVVLSWNLLDMPPEHLEAVAEGLS